MINKFFDNFDYAIKNLDKEKINQLIMSVQKIKKNKGRIFF